jgi:hypothetical protein
MLADASDDRFGLAGEQDQRNLGPEKPAIATNRWRYSTDSSTYVWECLRYSIDCSIYVLEFLRSSGDCPSNIRECLLFSNDCAAGLSDWSRSVDVPPGCASVRWARLDV